MKAIGRLLVLAGGAAVIGAAFLPWVTVGGAPLDLELLRVGVTGVNKTVAGTDTAAWPGVVAVGGLVALLGVLNVARKLVLLLGLLVTVAGAGLLYYAVNVVDIESKGNAVTGAVAGALAYSTAGTGPFVLVAGGLAILAGYVLMR